MPVMRACLTWMRRSGARRALCLVLLAFAGLALLPATPARAQFFIEDYQALVRGMQARDRAKTETLRYLLLGLIDGLEGVNAAYVAAGARPILCLPQNPRPSLNEVMQAIDQEIRLNQSYGLPREKKFGELVIMYGLMRRWPCA